MATTNSEVNALQEHLLKLSSHLLALGNHELATTFGTAGNSLYTRQAATPAVKALYENAAHWRGLREVAPKGFSESAWRDEVDRLRQACASTLAALHSKRP